MRRISTEGKCINLAILVLKEAVRKVVLQSERRQFEQIRCSCILDVAANPTSVNFDLGTSKAHIAVNALVVVDVSNVLHGSPL